MTLQKGIGSTPRRPEYDDPAAVSAYMSALDHPLKSVVEAVRRAILEADPTITEGVKWNSPSFYCHGWFATVNLRGKDSVTVVLHHGAKVRDDSALSLTMEDPLGLLAWQSPDRATVRFESDGDFQGKREAFKAIIRQWAEQQRHFASLA